MERWKVNVDLFMGIFIQPVDCDGEAVTFSKNQVRADIEYQAMYSNVFEYLRPPPPPPPKKPTVTEIQSQIYYVTREDINRP